MNLSFSFSSSVGAFFCYLLIFFFTTTVIHPNTMFTIPRLYETTEIPQLDARISG